MTAPLVDDLTDVEAEFAKPCANPDCSNPATWSVWVAHGCLCREVAAFVCDVGKGEIESDWIDALREQWTCSCGHAYVGQLSDHFRAIRL